MVECYDVVFTDLQNGEQISVDEICFSKQDFELIFMVAKNDGLLNTPGHEFFSITSIDPSEWSKLHDQTRYRVNLKAWVNGKVMEIQLGNVRLKKNGMSVGSLSGELYKIGKYFANGI